MASPMEQAVTDCNEGIESCNVLDSDHCVHSWAAAPWQAAWYICECRTVRNPSSVPARNTRTAISPLLAHRILLKGVCRESCICTHHTVSE